MIMKPSTAINKARKKLEDRWQYYRLQYSNELALEALMLMGYSSEEAFDWLDNFQNEDGSIKERVLKFIETHKKLE